MPAAAGRRSMEGSHFDALVKGLATRSSRRHLLRLVAGSLLGGLVAAPPARPAAAGCANGCCACPQISGCPPPSHLCFYGGPVDTGACIDCGDQACCPVGSPCCCPGTCCANADCPGGLCAPNGACACPPTRTFCGTPG